LAFVIPANWTTRTFKLHVDKVIQYWADGELKGEINFSSGVKFSTNEPVTIDGHTYCYEVSNKSGDSVIFSANSSEEAESWKKAILSVVNDTYQRDSRLEKLSELIRVLNLELVLDEQACKESLVASGYKTDRFVEIFYVTYLDNLIERIEKFIERDPGLFVNALKESMHGSNKIVFRPKNNTDRPGYYVSSFNPSGDLVIAFTKDQIWTNIYSLGADIEDIIQVNGVPYVVAQGCQEYQAKLDSSLRRLEGILRCGNIRLIADFNALRAMFDMGNYKISRYGEIIYDVYMSSLIDSIDRAIDGDESKIDFFRRNFYGLTIMIVYAPQEQFSGYHQCSFLNGSFILKIKNFYTNMSELGNDIPQLLSA